MPPPDAVLAHYEAQRRQAEAAVVLSRRQWRQMGPDFDPSWARILPRLTLVVASAQTGAARAGAAYVPAALAEAGQDVAPLATVRPEAWAGTAADGRPLDGLLYAAVARSKEAVAHGASPVTALESGGKWLETLVRTQVADAARGAAGAAIAARPGIGYVRMVATPCCQRCAVLAGRWYRWNQGFLRHPRCRCRHTPASRNSADSFTDVIGPDDIRDLTKAQRAAIDEGADMNRVINSHRAGKRSADGMTTTELARPGRRLTPEGIYRVSATREEAVARLRQNGYLL